MLQNNETIIVTGAPYKRIYYFFTTSICTFMSFYLNMLEETRWAIPIVSILAILEIIMLWFSILYYVEFSNNYINIRYFYTVNTYKLNEITSYKISFNQDKSIRSILLFKGKDVLATVGSEDINGDKAIEFIQSQDWKREEI